MSLIDRKLSDEDVRQIRFAGRAGVSDRDQAAKYNVSPAFIAAIRLGRSRKRAGGPITKRARTTSLPVRVADLEAKVERLEAALEAVGATGVG